MWLRTLSSNPGSPTISGVVMPVRIGPGQMQFTRIFSQASSNAVARTRFTTAPFAVLYAHMPGSPPSPETDAVITTEPPPAQHFDSGLVAGAYGFPILDARVSVKGQFCSDTVIDLVAESGASGS